VKASDTAGAGTGKLRASGNFVVGRAAVVWKYLMELPKPEAIFIGISLTLGVGVVDWLIPQEYSLSVLYLIPVIVVTILSGRAAGFSIAFLSAILWLGTDLARSGGLERAFVVIWNSVVELIVFLAVVLILSRLMLELKRQKENACSDVLTGIANRRGFLEQADKELNRSRRMTHPLAVMYLDLDDFKIVNDKFGHPCGDRLLHQVAEEIQRNTRSFDVVGRLGGDEFALLLPETNAPAARNCAVNILTALSEMMRFSGWPVTFSIGLATFYEPAESVEIMLDRADQLMYEAKQRGKNRIMERVIGIEEPLPNPSRL
jgi:diguanylate cyclase (GGDEF)-like protein